MLAKQLLVGMVLTLTLLPASALAVEEGDEAPNFSLAGNKIEQLALSDFRGKVVYLDFWASWCPPCVHSLPWMAELQKKFGTEKFQVIALNLDEDKALADKLLKKSGADLLVAYDPSGEMPGKYEVPTMPSSYIVGKDGKIVKAHHGFHEEDKAILEKVIAELIQQ